MLLWLLVILIIVGIKFYGSWSEDWHRVKHSIIVTIKKKISEIIVSWVLLFILVTFLDFVFYINLIKIFEYWKILLTICIVLKFVSGKKLYKFLRFYIFLEMIEEGEFNYTSPENIFQEYIEHYKAMYLLEIQKFEILKSLTPISIITLIAGRIIEGENIKINWNWFTVIFFTILCIYFYNLWNCYENMRIFKKFELETTSKLRRFKSK